MSRRIVILVVDGFSDSGPSIAFDALRTANALAHRAGAATPFEIELASAHGGLVRAASGVEVATKHARIAARADVLLVPGTWAEDGASIDVLLARADVQNLVRVIERAHARGAIIGSSCGGAFLLAEAGLLDGHECTTTWWLAPHLQKRRPATHVNAARSLVVHRNVLTAGALFAQADLVLHLVTRFMGPAIARQCSRLLLLDSHPSQAAYMAIQQVSTNDESVRRAEAWVRKHLADDFDIAAIATAVGLAPRTLARRLLAAVGVTPIGFVQRLRIEKATHLLETTKLSMQEISTSVGYADPNTLRRLVQRETRWSPSELRRRASRSVSRDTRASR